MNRGLVIAPGCYDAISALLAQKAGFEVLHVGGLAVEASQLGAPDLGLMTMTEVAAHAGRIAGCVDIPVIADVDTGFGGVLNVARTIAEMERAGVAGVHIEDQTVPKHCPLLAGRAVVPLPEALDRIKAALDARTDPDFVIAARTDADTISFQAIVDRCNRYLEAGADLVMPIVMNIEGTPFFSLSPDEQMDWLRKLISQIDGPVMGMGSGPPAGYTMTDMGEAGYRLVMYAASPLGAAANALSAFYADLREKDSDVPYMTAHPGPYYDPMTLMQTARLDAFVAFEAEHSSPPD